ncbi:MAG: DUF5317 domain-containing protein [Actinomycetota bacterium]|nr:DUF5317 domain-containing protein [Actinomycetota bacterium]
MFLVALFGLFMLTVPLAGGDLGALASVRFRHTWTVIVGLALQIMIISIIPFSNPGMLAAAHLVSYGFIGAFVYANRSERGLWVLGAGWGCNLAAIAANGGIMPTASAVVTSSARTVAANEFINSRTLEHPKLQFLGDIFAIPRSWPLHNVFSVGDVLIAAGAFILLHSLCRSKLARYWRSGRDRATLGPQAPTPSSEMSTP